MRERFLAETKRQRAAQDEKMQTGHRTGKEQHPFGCACLSVLPKAKAKAKAKAASSPHELRGPPHHGQGQCRHCAPDPPLAPSSSTAPYNWPGKCAARVSRCTSELPDSVSANCWRTMLVVPLHIFTAPDTAEAPSVPRCAAEFAQIISLTWHTSDRYKPAPFALLAGRKHGA